MLHLRPSGVQAGRRLYPDVAVPVADLGEWRL